MRKKILLLLAFGGTWFMTMSCDENEYCVSCISEDTDGVTMDHEVKCNENANYIDGFEDGFRRREEEKGHVVNCAFY